MDSKHKRLKVKDLIDVAVIEGKAISSNLLKGVSLLVMSKLRRFKIGLILLTGLYLSLGSVCTFAEPLEDAKNAYGAGEFEEAVTLLRPLVRQENKDAAFLLGRMYEQGDGIAKDLTEAKRLYRIAANKGHEDAQQRLDIFDAQGKDESIVIEWYLPAALEGDSDAQYNLGFMYETGWGVLVDEQEAGKWYQKASKMQHDVAQLRLGMMTIIGAGVESHQEKGVDLIRNAAENGNRIAEAIIQDVYDVGELTSEQSSRIIAGLRRIIDKGEAITLNTLRRNLRDVHKKKIKPVQKPLQKPKVDIVKTLTKKKASLASLDATETNGAKAATTSFSKAPATKPGPKPTKNVFKFYSDAARLGDADAQYHLGSLYIKGDHVQADMEEGLYWIKLAADQGHEMAATYLEMWQDDITPNTLNSSIAINWLKESGRQWNQDAVFNLGFLYETGRGVDVNFNKATQWYRFAAVEGHNEAKRRLALIKKGQGPAEDGVSSIQAPRPGLTMSPFIIAGVLIFIAALLGVMLHFRKIRSGKMPLEEKEQQEVIVRAKSAQGMQVDDRKFFDELWGTAPGKGSPDESAKPKKDSAPRKQASKPESKLSTDSADKLPELSEVEKKLAKAVDDLINISPEVQQAAGMPVEKQSKPEPKPVLEDNKTEIEAVKPKQIEAIKKQKSEKPTITDNKPAIEASAITDTAIALENEVSQEKTDVLDASVLTTKTVKKLVLVADDFLSNGISKDALAASRISADRLFADGIAIDEAGKAVGQGSFDPHKLDAEVMLSIEDLSLQSSSVENVKKKKPVGPAASLLPTRTVEEEAVQEVDEIHKADSKETSVNVSGPLTQEEERSLAEVHYNIGVMFSVGDGVPKNDAQAAKWFLKAAEEGLPEAQYNIGQCYLLGTGLVKNTVLGMDWLQKAADNKYLPAIEMLKKRNQAM